MSPTEAVGIALNSPSAIDDVPVYRMAGRHVLCNPMFRKIIDNYEPEI